MQSRRANRLRGALLWVVVAGLWIAVYPDFNIPKRDFFLILLAMFFIFGVQKFEGAPEDLGRFVGSSELPIVHSSFAPLWLKYRVPLFLFLADVCIVTFLILRVSESGLVR